MGKRIDKYLRLQPDVQYRIHIKSMILTNQSCALLLSMARGLQLDTLSARMTIFIYILSHSSLLLAQYNPLSLLIVLGKLSIAFNALLDQRLADCCKPRIPRRPGELQNCDSCGGSRLHRCIREGPLGAISL